MKHIFYYLAILTLLFVLKIPNSFGQTQNFSISIKGSTTGYGGDLVFQFHEKMSARIGVDHMKLSFPFEFKQDGIDYSANASIRTGTILALYDYHIAEYVFATAGVGFNNFNINASGAANSSLPWGDIEIPAEKIGTFVFDIKPKMRLSPYLGLGFGRTLSLDKLVGFSFELGSFFQGAPDISIESDGLLAPTSDPDHGQEILIEGQLKQYYLYPVLKLNLSFKILSF
ncbi:MAG: hypothetical protein JW735_06165 [Prolixibacteraceae bacterium]|nr:hypothetical protein [Prolixibacteraceae bacterium]